MGKRCPVCRRKVSILKVLPKGWERSSTKPLNKSGRSCSRCYNIIRDDLKVSNKALWGPSQILKRGFIVQTLFSILISSGPQNALDRITPIKRYFFLLLKYSRFQVGNTQVEAVDKVKQVGPHIQVYSRYFDNRRYIVREPWEPIFLFSSCQKQILHT